MISSKLKKGKTSELLVEFSKNSEQWPSVISKFHETCKDESVKVNKTLGLKPGMMRFYAIHETSQNNNDSQKPENQLNQDKVLRSRITQIELKFTVIYMSDQSQQIPQFSQFFTSQNCNSRVLLLRETLSPLYDLNYEIESTLSPQQSITYLCDLSASLINTRYEAEIQQYQQKKQLMIRKGNEGKLSPAQATWRNMMFQVPGIGKDKVKTIAGDFPSYEKMVGDCDSKKSLKNLVVGRGVKGAKIGKSIADRIYKVFGSSSSKEKLY